MLLDLAARYQPQHSSRPLDALPASPGEIADAAWEAQKLRGWFGLSQLAPHTAFEEWAENFRRAGLQPPRNPFDAPPDARTDPLNDAAQRLGRAMTGAPSRAALTEAWRAAAARARAQFPELADTFPDPFEIEEGARRRAVQAQARAEEMASGSQGLLGDAAGFAGGMAAAILTDPLQIVTLPLGAPSALAGGLAMRILKTAAIEGGIAAATQAASTALNREAQLAAGIAPDPLSDIALAGAGGAVLGGGLRAAVEAWRAVRGVAPPNSDAQAAAGIAQAAEMQAAGNPGGAATAAAHAEALDQALADAAAGQPTAASVANERLRGFRPEEEQRLGVSAAARVLAQQIDAPAAMYRPDVGDITFHYGTPGNSARDFRGGWGMSHIEAKHGADVALNLVPDILANGTAQRFYGPPDGRRVDIVTERGQVTLSLYRDRVRETWVLTGFDFRPDGGGAAGPGGGPGFVPGGSLRTTPSRYSGGVGAGPASDMAAAGDRGKVFTPTGRAIEGQYRVVELDTLIPSNLDDFSPNPAYPHAEGVQPRDRSRESDRQQVRDMASRLSPELLGRSATADTGAPIIGPDNVVESGNGRILALRLAARANPDSWAAYQSWLSAQGFDLSAFRQPVLVMDRISALTPAERAAFVVEANAPTAARMSAAETARADAGRLDAILDLHKGGDVALERNADFARAFLASLPRSEANALRTADGGLSADGARRLRAALLARAYGDQAGPLLERMLENADTDIKAIAGALDDAAADWARMRALAARGLLPGAPDRTADLMAAVRAVEHARGTGQRVDDWLATGDFLDPNRGLSDQAMAMLEMFFRDDAPPFSRAAGRESVAARLKGYADAAVATRQAEMFEPPAPRAAAAAEPAAEPPSPPPGRPRGLAEPAAAAPAPAPDPVAPNVQLARATPPAAEPDARADASLFFDAQRAAAAQDVAVPIVRDDGAAASLGARQLLDEAEDDAARAAAAAACLIGGAAA